GVGLKFAEEALIEVIDEVESSALLGAGFARDDVANGFWGIGFEDGGLVQGGEETVAEQADAAVGRDGGAALQDDIGRQVLAFVAESVAGPGTSAGVAEKREAG